MVLQLVLDAPKRVHSLGLFEPALSTVPSAEAFGEALSDIATLCTGDFPALFSWTLSDEDVQSISQPALTVLGTDSEPLFQEVLEVLEANLPGVESFPLVGAFHFL